MCDPRTTEQFWQTWKDFEIKHGNEDTLREMLRIKRSVQALYNTQVDFMAAQMVSQASGGDLSTAAAGNAMAALEDKMRQQQQAQQQAAGTADAASTIKFVRGGTLIEKQPKNGEDNEKLLAKNPAEIDINFDDDEEDEEDNQEQPVVSSRSKGLPPVVALVFAYFLCFSDLRNLEKQPVPLEVFGGLINEEDEVSKSTKK